jgi:HNH endonuclease
MTTNQLRRQAALAHYYAAPNFCRECGTVILVPEGVKVKLIRIKHFCNRACANRFNNRSRMIPQTERVNRERTRRSHRLLPSVCQHCGQETRSREGRRKLCDTCYRSFRFPDGVTFPERTKQELFARRSSWQSARSSIRNHAHRIYCQSGKPLACLVCGYATHVDIAHLRPVNSFPDAATIHEINDISNLIPLCPNHHWELDNGILSRACLESLRGS